VLAAKPPFEELYRDFVNRVYGYVRAQVGSAADAEDVTAQVFLKAYEAYERFQPVGATPSAWLFRIARNAALDHLRSSVRRERLARAVGREPAEAPDPQALAEERIEHAELVALLAELGDRQREVIALRHSGLSFAEVGEVIGTSEDAAKMAYHRSLRVLRELAHKRSLLE
jgi:RNA polymerase sigma-70 factor (ECF subfamily)